MKELSLHILDIVMNSVKAQATMVELEIEESISKNILKIIIKDNGNGMDKEVVDKVSNPFYTTRNTRRVGLGIPLLKEACERCNGYFKIDSAMGKGTVVEAVFQQDNIDRAPIGNMGETIIAIINSMEDSELSYTHKTDKGMFQMSTLQIKEILNGVDINDSSIILWIMEYVNSSLRDLY